YSAIYAIQGNANFNSLSGSVEIVAGVDTEQAKIDFTQFLSLYYLLAFSLRSTDPDAQGILANAHASLLTAGMPTWSCPRRNARSFPMPGWRTGPRCCRSSSPAMRPMTTAR